MDVRGALNKYIIVFLISFGLNAQAQMPLPVDTDNSKALPMTPTMPHMGAPPCHTTSIIATLKITTASRWRFFPDARVSPS